MTTCLSSNAEIEVAEGSVAVAVAFRGLPVYSETKDLCERTSCPVAKGPLNLSYDEYLPPIVPPVSFRNCDWSGFCTVSASCLCVRQPFHVDDG